MRDYRRLSAAVIAGRAQLPEASSEGCAAVSGALPKPADRAASVTLDGGFVGAAELAEDGVFRLEARDTATPFDASQTTTATVEAEGSATTLTAPEVPETALVQLGGPYEVVLSLNMPLAAVNEAMAASTSDLFVDDAGSGEGYDGVVVMLFGARRSQAVRCVVRPGGSVTVPHDVYRPLLPLRGVVGMHVNVVVETTGGRTTWAASAVGNGIELVPSK
jgi:hypothetical protein